jgi:hypothetical protein
VIHLTEDLTTDQNENIQSMLVDEKVVVCPRCREEENQAHHHVIRLSLNAENLCTSPGNG